MLDCFAVQSSPSASSSAPNSHPRPPPPPGGSSPAIDIHSAYDTVIRSNPHIELWISPRPSSSVPIQLPSPGSLEDDGGRLPTLADVLHPNQELVNKELLLAKASNLKRLISDFFRRSEDTTRLLLDLKNSAAVARRLYQPVEAVLDELSFDSLSQPQTNRAYDEFARFHGHANPFSSPDPNNLDEIRQSFSQLKIYLNRRIRKSKSKIQLICLPPAHSAFCPARFCSAHAPPTKDPAQQNAAARKLFVLEHELSSLDNLVKRLRNAVEDVRDTIRFGLVRGRDKHSIAEVLKQLRREKTAFLKQLESLDKHISHCHGVVSSARCLLLAEVSSSIN